MTITILWYLSLNKQKFHRLLINITKRYLTNVSVIDQLIQQCYSVLEIDPSCQDETVIRKAYLDKVKQYHPDSSFQYNHEKFNQIQQAYETLMETLRTNNSLDHSSSDDIQITFDIRHTAPQHRTHLEYGGYGMGTPSQRQTAYYKMRAQKAHENVYEYQRDRETIETREELIERKKRKDVRATNFIDRLVEDLIQESMLRGDFNNIKPSNKTLHQHNPHYMDFTTYKINEILIENGYMPEWILIEKQIRESIEQARINLKCIFKRLASENFQSSNEQKIDLSNHIQWLQALEKFHNEITEINNNIDKLNLIVPMLWRQQVHYNVEQEIKKIISLDPMKIELPSSIHKLTFIHQQESINHQLNERYSVFDAIRDLFHALKHFKI